MIVPPPTLVIDTREALPWPATIRRGGRLVSLPIVRAKLCVGDYSIMGYESEIASTRADVEAHKYISIVSPRAALCRSDSLAKLGVPVQWMGTRDAAAAFAMGELIRWWARRWSEKGATASDLAAALDAAERSAASAPPAAVSKPWRGAPLGGMPTDTSEGRRMKQEARRAAGR